MSIEKIKMSLCPSQLIKLLFSWAPSQTFKNGCTGHLPGSVGEASAFGSGRDPGVLGSSPSSGSLLGGESASPSLSAAPPACALSLCQIKTLNLFKKMYVHNHL